MTPRKDETDEWALENLIDRHGLSRVMAMLAKVCADKGKHLVSNWGDGTLADMWMYAGAECVRATKRGPIAELTAFEGRVKGEL